MKKRWMKFTSMLMAVVMVLSMSLTAFAASSPTTTGSITIDGYAGEEYTIYQILDLTYAEGVDESGDKTITSYSYTVCEDWVSFLTESYSDYFTLIKVDGVYYVDPTSKIFEEEDDSAFLSAFAKAAIAYAEENGIEGQTETAVAKEGATADPDTNTTEGTATFSGLSLGWYVVSSTIGTVVSLDTTDPSVTIEDKNEVPVVHKYLVDTDYDEQWDATGDEEGHKKDEGDNNDTMEYKLVVDNVGNIKNLVIHDYLDPDQLDAETLKIKSIILYNSAEDTEGTDITESCTITESTCGGEDCGLEGCSFEIDIPDSILDGEGVGRDAYIVVLYDISLNESVDHFVDDVDEIDNYVNITFGARAVGIPEEVQTYSYGFKVFKYTEGEENDEGETEQIALAGAEFVISKTSGESTVYAKFTLDADDPDTEYKGSGIYLFDSWVETQDEATTLVSGSDGIVHVDGLHDGTFIVTETKAPDGYNLLENSITVTLTTTNDLGSFTVNGSSDHTVNVLNNAGQRLPGTGGIGTTIFYVIGTILVLGAVALMLAKWRMGKTE